MIEPTLVAQRSGNWVFYLACSNSLKRQVGEKGVRNECWVIQQAMSVTQYSDTKIVRKYQHLSMYHIGKQTHWHNSLHD